MPLFSYPNPTCDRTFTSSHGMEQHMRQNNNCANYAAATRLFESSSSESDSETKCEEIIVDVKDIFLWTYETMMRMMTIALMQNDRGLVN